jgi:hypothetical protein
LQGGFFLEIAMRLIILAPAALLAAATTLLSIKSSAQPPTPAIERTPSGISSIRADPAQARSSIWTPARMRDVEAAPLPVVDPDAVRAAFTAQRSSPGTSGATAGSASSAGLGRRSGNVRSYPLTQVGQLFFNTNKDKPGWGNVCTAQFIDEDVILTASHCVQDDTPPYAYHKNFLFSLQYERGSFDRQYGWKCVANKTAWAQRSQAR